MKELELQLASQYLSTDGYDWRAVTWGSGREVDGKAPVEVAAANVMEMEDSTVVRELDGTRRGSGAL
jgi:hypothetical protein